MLCGSRNPNDNSLSSSKTTTRMILTKTLSMSWTYFSLETIPCSMVKTGLPKWNSMAAKDAKTLSLTNSTILWSTSTGKKKCSRVMALLTLTKKRIWSFSSNVNFYLDIDFKSLKQIKLCEGSSNIYTHGHTILAESACIYEVNSSHSVFIDPADYLTQ